MKRSLNFLLAIIPGAIPGVFLRYWLSELLPNNEHSFYLATLLINVSGSFLLGFLFSIFIVNPGKLNNVRLALTVGFLGSYTTFSTFGLQVGKSLEYSHFLVAINYTLISVFGSILSTFLGLSFGRLLTR